MVCDIIPERTYVTNINNFCWFDKLAIFITINTTIKNNNSNHIDVMDGLLTANTENGIRIKMKTGRFFNIV